MSSIPSRDINGKCDGECRNLVREAEEDRQICMASVAYSIEDSTPSMSWASSRDAAPGFFGGHV